ADLKLYAGSTFPVLDFNVLNTLLNQWEQHLIAYISCCCTCPCIWCKLRPPLSNIMTTLTYLQTPSKDEVKVRWNRGRTKERESVRFISKESKRPNFQNM
uniref:Uncharacterized protein n=1 Tax=Aegilops tauschii subsp. strangulata TaxID=200361 RepID=A0A453I343_AEGTS